MEIKARGLTFDVYEDGPADGRPVLLLHGFPQDHREFDLLVPRLHAAGLQTYALDQRGYSPGARPPRRRDYAAGRLVGDALALIDTIGGPVHLVGHDWGAAVGWGVVMTRPEQVRSWTAVSVPHTGAFATSWVTSTQGLKSWYMGLFQLPRLPELSARKPRGPFDRSMRRSGMTAEDLARFRTEIVEYGALPGGLAWYRAIPFTSPGAARRRVTVPTTLVWSDGDVAVGRAAVDATARWVDAPYELVVLGGVSHWIPTQAPEALADAILARVAG
jgi:pimeloyl-ACP methyl ester carboxylesterase